MKKYHIEPLTSLLRLGGEYGEQCHFSATLRHINPTRCEVLGVSEKKEKPDPKWMAAIIEEIKEALIDAGFESAFYQRKKPDGTTKIVEFFKTGERRQE